MPCDGYQVKMEGNAPLNNFVDLDSDSDIEFMGEEVIIVHRQVCFPFPSATNQPNLLIVLNLVK